MFVNIGILFIALSFTVIVFYLIRVLQSVSGAIGSLDRSVEQLEDQMEDITDASRNLIKQSNHTVDELEDKINTTSGLIQTIQHVGTMLDSVNHRVGRSADHFSSHASERSSQIVKIVRWGNAAFQVFEGKIKRN